MGYRYEEQIMERFLAERAKAKLPGRYPPASIEHPPVEVAPVVPRSEPDEHDWLWLKVQGSLPTDLTPMTMKAVRQRFSRYDNQRPSDDEYTGLTQIALCIEAMADSGLGKMQIGGLPSQLPRNYLVSHMAPGTGKSTVVLEAVKQLCSMPEYDEIGVLVLLSRYDEIRKFAAELETASVNYSVIVADGKDENQLGLADKTKARVLLTTQEGLRLRSSDRRFADLEALYFNGKPRQVRIWDEAIMPSQNLTVGADLISTMFVTFKDNGQIKFADELKAFNTTLETLADQSLIEVPDWSRFGIAVDDAREWFKGWPDKVTGAAEALLKLSGQTVRVRKDHLNSVMLHYEDSFPPDLAPLLVLDASGEFRQTYWFWHESRKGLRFLFSPKKAFAGLTIHQWSRGSGNEALERNQQVLAEGIALTIKGIPKGEEVLVIHRKETKRRNMKGAILLELAKLDPDRTVHFLPWGYHTATNEYGHVKHVFLAGVLNYSVPGYEATGRGAKGMPSTDILSDPDFEKTRAGEVAHNIYQAACRGLVRHSVNGSCPAGCHLYVIAPVNKDKGVPPRLLARTFPGSLHQDWLPIVVLKGQQKRLADFLEFHPGTHTKLSLAQMVGPKVRATRITDLIDGAFRTYMGTRGLEVEVTPSTVSCRSHHQR